MNKTIKFLPLVAATAALAGCQDYDLGFDAKEIAYKHNFEKAFGQINPEQDFNLATRASVSVTVDRPSQVKIYAKYGRNYKLVADYKEVTGTQVLGFDVVEGTTDIRVTDGSIAKETTVGGSVSFDASDMTRGFVTTGLSTPKDDWFVMNHDLATAWVKIIPERGSRSTKYGTNLGKVTQDFTYVSQGNFTMYPMFSWTSGNDQIGIYFTDKQGNYHEVIVMDNNFNNDNLQYRLTTEAEGTWNAPLGHQPSYGYQGNITDDGTHTLDNIAEVRGKGVTISLPPGTVFGMFLFHSNSEKKFYSESNLNEDVSVTETRNTAISEGTEGAYTITNNMNKKACHASSFYCTVDGKEYQFLGFEDWDNMANNQGESDFDLNDFMILFDGVLPSVNDQETPGWVLAYEDLGNTFDWDFNDIVAKVQYVSGQDYATFTPLAAVGTLNSYVKYKGEYITKDKTTSEIHAMMGATDNAPHAIINGYSKGNPGKSVTFEVEKTFSMTVLGDVADMGGLTLEVEKVADDPEPAVIAYAGEGITPEVICLPEFWYDNDDAPRYRSEWAWPTEHSSIKYVYPKFSAWVSSKEDNGWYKDEPQGERGTGGTVGDDTKGSAVTGGFITKLATGTIVERVDPKPITVLHDPIYVGVGSNIPFSEIFTTVSNGRIKVSSANTSVASVSYESDYAQGNINGGSVGQTTITIHQMAGTSGEGDTFKQWPVSDETVQVIVVAANTMTLGNFDQYNGTVDHTTSAITAFVGEDFPLYYFTTAGSNGGVFSAKVNEENGVLTIGNPEPAALINTTGFITVHAAKAGTATITVNQARNDNYAAAEKTITINVSKSPTNLSVSQNEVTVGRGNTAEVNVTTNNTESEVQVSSNSDNATAVYENGKIIITGVSNGEAEITVSQAGNDSFEAATYQTISVTVTNPQHILTITSPSNLQMEFDNTKDSQTISASCSTDGTITYSDYNTTYISVSETGEVTPLADGVTDITVTASGDGYESVSKTIHVVVSNYPVNYGTRIESFAQGIGSPNNYPAFKISSSDIPSGKTIKVTGVYKTGYAQIYCATSSYGASIEFAVNEQNPLLQGSKSTSEIGSNDYYICIQNGNASDVEVYYTFE